MREVVFADAICLVLSCPRRMALSHRNESSSLAALLAEAAGPGGDLPA
jgi:hypothetical protein